MTIPHHQFHLYFIDTQPFFYQTYEEALKEACIIAKSTEFIDLDPDSILNVKLYFPKTHRKVIIYTKLFTYDSGLQLITNRYNGWGTQKKKGFEYRNLLI